MNEHKKSRIDGLSLGVPESALIFHRGRTADFREKGLKTRSPGTFRSPGRAGGGRIAPMRASACAHMFIRRSTPDPGDEAHAEGASPDVQVFRTGVALRLIPMAPRRLPCLRVLPGAVGQGGSRIGRAHRIVVGVLHHGTCLQVDTAGGHSAFVLIQV